jgi:hypothetical protein
LAISSLLTNWMFAACSEVSDTPSSSTMSEIASVAPPAVVVNDVRPLAWMFMSATRTSPSKSW